MIQLNHACKLWTEEKKVVNQELDHQTLLKEIKFLTAIFFSPT